MRKLILLCLAGLLIVLGGAQSVSFAIGQAASAKAPAVDPKAAEVLRNMGNYLESLQQFKVRSVRTLEIILPDNQRIHADRTMDISIQRPDHMRIDLKSAKRDLEIYYDGKNLTLFSPKNKFYAVVAAKPTISETLQFVSGKYGIDFPVMDLLQKSRQDLLLSGVQRGDYVGTDMIDGVKCHHLAFRQRNIDWQIWIEEGEKPLPKRIIINDKTQKGEPQSITTFSDWEVSPTFEAGLFNFTAPDDAKQIGVIEAPSGQPVRAARSQKARLAKD